MQFCEKVKEVRSRLYLTQHQMAQELGVSYPTISRWEKAHVKPTFLMERKFDEFCRLKGIYFSKQETDSTSALQHILPTQDTNKQAIQAPQIKVGYQTKYGECIFGDSLLLLDQIQDNSINLVMTSPPFALQRMKEYGNESQDNYVDWLIEFGKKIYTKLRADGSFVIDIGGAYESGVPSFSLYQFRVLIRFCDEIGFKLAQPFYWHNSSALPSPIEWVNKRKLRAKSSVNTVWWLCKDTMRCKAEISKVLVPYSARMQQLIANPNDFIKDATAMRPSGHLMEKSSWGKDNGGAIPSNLLQYPNSESNSQYLRFCKYAGIKGHPARFPSALPEFFIKFLTNEGDIVLDIFSGSNTTGMVAEKLQRKWLSFDLSQEYVANSIFRFIDDAESAKKAYQSILNGEFLQIG